MINFQLYSIFGQVLILEYFKMTNFQIFIYFCDQILILSILIRAPSSNFGKGSNKGKM
jgi:hypothetical protein